MALHSKVEKYRLTVGLLVVSLVGAAGIAYFGSHGTRSVSNEGSREGAPAPDSRRPDASTARGLGAARAPGESAREAAVMAPGTADTAKGEAAVTPPTPEEIEGFRRPAPEQNLEVRDKGIDALVEAPTCGAPTRMVDTGRRGPGGLGCKLDVQGHGPVFVGRWAFRNGSGMLEVGDFQSGMRTGTWKQYFRDGHLAAEGEYVDDRRVGVWNEWTDTGEFFARRSYDNGQLHGVTVIFRGPTPEVEIYVHGRREGEHGPDPNRPPE